MSINSDDVTGDGDYKILDGPPEVKRPSIAAGRDRLGSAASRDVIRALLDPESEVDFSVVPNLTDDQLKEFIQSFPAEDTFLVMRKFNKIYEKRYESLRKNLSFRNICYKKGDDTFLMGISGYLRQGSMMCVLGAPDSGITTLLKTLAGCASKDAIVSGEILLDGQPTDLGYKQHVGYIRKEDLHYALLTVRETLLMSARTRVGEVDDVYSKLLVEITLKFMGLDGPTADTIIGDATRRGVSGGQRRRVSIAQEFVAGHAIIIADMLTNGLDSSTAFDLIAQMRLAAQSESPKSFMISLVQPAEEILELFDTLLLMSKGHAIFFGPMFYGGKYPVIEFLAAHGFYQPPEKSVPDFLAEISDNPVRFHVTRLPKQIRQRLGLRADGTRIKDGDSRDDSKGAGADARDSKRPLPDGSRRPDRKTTARKEADAQSKRGKQARSFTSQKLGSLRSALFNRQETDPYSMVIVSDAGAPETDQLRQGEPESKAASAIPVASSVPTRNFLKLTGGPSVNPFAKPAPPPPRDAKAAAVADKSGDLKKLALERKMSSERKVSLESNPLSVSTSDSGQGGADILSTDVNNEREVGYTYLLGAYKSSSYYASLGQILWVEFMGRLPWEKTPTTPQFGRSQLYQTYECLRREVIVTLRDRVTLIGSFMQKIFVSLILGTMFVKIPDTQQGADALVGLVFIILIQTIMVVVKEIPTVMHRRRVYFAQETSGFYHGNAFFFAQRLIVLPLHLLQVFVSLVVVYPICGLEGGVFGAQFWYVLVLLFFAVACADTWSLFICSLSPNAVAAQALVPVTFVLFILVCGYLIVIEDIPETWSWMSNLSFLTYGFRGMMLSQFLGKALHCDGDEKVPATDYPAFNDPAPNGFNGQQVCPFQSGEAYLKTYDMDQFSRKDQGLCLFYMFLFIVGFHLLAWWGLVYRHHELADTEEAPKFDTPLPPNDEVAQRDAKDPVSFIEWRDLSYTVQNARTGKEPQILLNKVSGYAGPGDMVALMGPSGAGKSTLLDVIACKKTSGTITGTLLVNGAPPDDTFARIAGYVEQFDSHIETSTVEEAVRFSAQLRLNEPDEVVEAEVEKAMRSVSIYHARNRIIGNIDEGGISPELRKKAAIAVELVARPTILFLDEPTTGLDSVSAIRVIDTVAFLTRKGIAVVCTVHQPSAELFSRFDRILMLQPCRGATPGGRVSFFGPVEDVLPYCTRMGLGKCTKGRNVADFALEALGGGGQASGTLRATVARSRPASKGGSMARGKSVELRASIAEGAVHPADIFADSKENGELQAALLEGVFESARGTVRIPEPDGVYARTLVDQFRIVMYRTYLSTIRDVGTLKSQYGAIVGFSLIAGSLYYKLDNSQSGAKNRVSVLFLCLIFIFYTSSYKMNQLIEQRPAFYREKMANMYRGGVYYISQMFADTIVFVPRAIIFTLIVYFMTGLSLADEGTRLAEFLIMIIIIFYLALSAAEFIAFLMPNVQIGQGSFALSMTIQSLFCGFVVRKDNIPSWWSWLYYVNWIRYPLFFLCHNELKGEEYACTPNHKGAAPVPLNPSGVYVNTTTGQPQYICDLSQLDNPYCFRYYCPVTTGQEILDLYGATQSEGFYAAITIVFVIGLRAFNVVTFSKLNWIEK